MFPMSLAWALAILFATASSASPEHDGADWMAAIPNSWRLGSFSIPGTHDTCALHETVPNTARCQSMSLAEQLNAGLRYLDIRCRHMKDRFVIYHGIEYQHFSFEQVLETVNSFLDAHPSETIILSVNEEHKPSKVTRNFWETFEWYYAQNPARWHIGEVLPELGSVRGKIVLLRRFNTAGSIRGLDAATNWSNNHPGILRVGTQFSIQDWYFLPDLEPVSVNAKWALAKDLFLEATSDATQPPRMSVNHMSGFRMMFGSIPTGLTQLADDLRDRLRLQFLAEPHCHGGTVLLDFATPEVAQLIYRSSIPRSGDSDVDGVPDAQEVSAGTDPFTRDSDRDGTTNSDEAAAGTNPLDPLSNPAPWIEENAFGAIIAWNAQLQQTYCVEVCGIDPVTRAFIDWHSVTAENSCGIASVFAPIGSDGIPLPPHLRRWRVVAE